MNQEQFEKRLEELIDEARIFEPDWGSYNESAVGRIAVTYARAVFKHLGADEVYPLSYGDGTADKYLDRSGIGMEVGNKVYLEIWPYEDESK